MIVLRPETDPFLCTSVRASRKAACADFQVKVMKQHFHISAIAAAACIAGLLSAGCAQKQGVLDKDEQAQFGKYGQPMTPEVRAKYDAAMAAARKNTPSTPRTNGAQ